MDRFREGELVAYLLKSTSGKIVSIEVGKIKKLCEDGAFLWYHTGKTTAKTRYEDLYKIQNEYAVENLGGLNKGVGVW